MRQMISTYFAALAVSTLLSAPVFAAEDTDDQIARQSSAVAQSDANPAFALSGRKMLGYISEARVAIGKENKEVANALLDSALQELNSIRNTQDNLQMMQVPFGRVLYGQVNSYYIPIADDIYAIRSYAHGPFWSPNKATAVRDVELVNVNIAINPDKAEAHLEAAKQKIATDDFSEADKELSYLLNESIHQTAAAGQPYAKLQDNIYLTRVLMRQQNYEAARFTLKHAREALNDYDKTNLSPDQRADAENLRREMETMDATIQKRSPTMLSKATDKVEQWWKDLKAWTHEKTS
jgi:hypothetical protein